MAEKFLNAEGVSVLYNLLNMQDYPNNEMLIAIINAIDKTKADKDETVLTIPQTLTEEQKKSSKRKFRSYYYYSRA